jgi:hypothetical protein
MENIRKNAIPMKNVNDALVMRNTLLQHIQKKKRSWSPLSSQAEDLPEWKYRVCWRTCGYTVFRRTILN